jgi:excisionase family DNA binding protein
MLQNKDKKYLSTAELAKLIGVSRIAIFKKIKNKQIKAEKIGRNYVIPVEEFWSFLGTFVSESKKQEMDALVKKAVEEYGDTFRRLGKE